MVGVVKSKNDVRPEGVASADIVSGVAATRDSSIVSKHGSNCSQVPIRVNGALGRPSRMAGGVSGEEAQHHQSAAAATTGGGGGSVAQGPPPPAAPHASAPAPATKPLPPDDDKDSESDGDGAEEVLEESPCRRWSKRREQVKQRDVPGIDCAYLAMDNETGNEVVWNEVLFSERKYFKVQEAKINQVFDNLTHLVHPNLVKFHKYWTDNKSEKPRIIFITEYMSSGSMSLFLQRTRKSGSNLSLKAWQKWTKQILSALAYLHSTKPPIIHGNLTCHTVFIQQNGLIKIGSVAPDAINVHVKTCRDTVRYLHYIAPECEHQSVNTPATDVYAFGICALEIATCGALSGTGDGVVTPEAIQKAVDSLEDVSQRDLISSCLCFDPDERPSARQLLFHRVLFEVHSLKLLAAHSIVDSGTYDDFSESIFRVADTEKVVATCKFKEIAPCQVPAFQVELEKFCDDVRNGIYPLTAFLPLSICPTENKGDSYDGGYFTQGPFRDEKLKAGERASVETDGSSSKVGIGGGAASSSERSPSPGQAAGAPAPADTCSPEPRNVVQLRVDIELGRITIALQLDDCMNRQLVTALEEGDTADSLVHNLIINGFISEIDAEMVAREVDAELQKYFEATAAGSTSSAPATPSLPIPTR